MRVIIVDDEPLARDRLRGMLNKESDVEIAAECGDGKEALNAIRREKPDVVFLDIQMPEMDGFEVLSQLQPSEIPQVVFVTAFDEFAVKAFDVHALDYLLKPFDRDRLKQAVERARSGLNQENPSDLTKKLSALLESLSPERKAARGGERLAVKLDGRVIFLKPLEIEWIEAQDNYIKLHVGREAHLVRDTLSSFESRLDPRRFVRIGRSTIVNIDRVREMQPMFHGEYIVILHDGTKLTVSRGFKDNLQKYMGGK